MPTEDLEEWWENNLEKFDDEDFDGDIPEALADAMRTVAERNQHSKNKNNDIEGWLSGFSTGSHSGTLKEKLQDRAREPILKKISETKTQAELDRIDYNKLSGGFRGLKDAWSKQETRLVFREKAFDLTAEDIAIRRSRSVSGFAKFYNLEEDEAKDLLKDKGVLNEDGEIKYLEEL